MSTYAHIKKIQKNSFLFEIQQIEMPRLWVSEYTWCTPYRGVSPPKKGCPVYDSKLHQIVKL